MVDPSSETFSLYDSSSANASSSSVSVKEVSAPVGNGVVGCCVSSGEIQAVQNPSSDERYDAKVDALTDETPNSLLCAPILSSADGQVIAVLHLCGRKHAHHHNAEDIRLAEMFSSQLTSVIETIRPSPASTFSASFPLPPVPSCFFSIDCNLTTLCEMIETQLSSLVKADHHTLYLMDLTTETLEGASYSLPRSVPLNTGIIGDVASTRATANVANVHRDPNFNFDVDTQQDKLTQSVLVLPITTHDGLREKQTKSFDGFVPLSSDDSKTSLVGVVQILRGRRGKSEYPFSLADLQLVKEYVDSIMPSLYDWQKFQRKRVQADEIQTALEAASAENNQLKEEFATKQKEFEGNMMNAFCDSNESLVALLDLVSSASSEILLQKHGPNFSIDSIFEVVESILPSLVPSITSIRVLPLDHSNQVSGEQSRW